MNTFTINGKRYNAPKFDFNTVCDIEESGISLAQAKNKPTALLRVYFALALDGDKERAGKELEQHLINGGSFEELTDAMTKEMNESDFFRAASKGADEENQTGAEEKNTKKR